MDALYDQDFLLWSEREAERLRQLAAGERLNAPPDWENIIEEIESLGRSELRALESLLVQAMAHRLKTQGWPGSREVPHWQAEARGFLGEAARHVTPSMRRRLDLDGLYREAVGRLPETIDGLAPEALPPACPFTLDELLPG